MPQMDTATIVVAAAETTTERRRWMDVRQKKWLPETLQTLREEEGLLRVLEVKEASSGIYTPNLTQEPIHHTVPLLVTRMAYQDKEIHSLYGRLEDILLSNVETLQDEVNGLFDGAGHAQRDMETMHPRLVKAQAQIAKMHFRLERKRIQESENEACIRVLEQHLKSACWSDIGMVYDLMDHVKCQGARVMKSVDNKRKWEYNPRGNFGQLQNKRHEVVKAYTAGPNIKKEYGGS
ncbi:hypothetical protein Tco_0772396 [Tanacetum coccineum]|uniref:Uncharacterized protein n=1 Tax=Tanacetum coccineum TaxID=301880 RepID=A0ABQ4ZI04_9ASTR